MYTSSHIRKRSSQPRACDNEGGGKSDIYFAICVQHDEAGHSGISGFAVGYVLPVSEATHRAEHGESTMEGSEEIVIPVRFPIMFNSSQL